MLRHVRHSRAFGRFGYFKTAFAILAGSVLLAGCSADVLRFNAPALGLSGASDTEPPQPVHSDGSLFDQQPSRNAGSPSPGYAPPASSGRVESSRLADAAPLADEPPASNNTYPQSRETYAPRRRAPLTVAESDRQSRPNDRVTVRQGDTLYEIARRNGVSVRDIKDANGLTSNVIRPGQVLYLTDRGEGSRAGTPEPRFEPRRPPNSVDDRTPSDSDLETYTVQPGDSLYAISRRTGVRVADLRELNSIRDVRRIRPGMVLRLRDSGGGAGTGSDERRYAGTSTSQEPVRSPQRTRPLSGNEPIILNPRSNQRISEPERRAPRTETAMRQPSARAPTTSERQSSGVGDFNFRWPVRGRIIRGFGKRSDGSNNDGINIAVPIGSDVHASERGTVAYAGNELKGYGNLILVRHDNGYVTAYAHADRMLVRRGDEVRRGQVIAKAGKTGAVSQPQLHFELRQGAKPVDPMPHLGRM